MMPLPTDNHAAAALPGLLRGDMSHFSLPNMHVMPMHLGVATATPAEVPASPPGPIVGFASTPPNWRPCAFMLCDTTATLSPVRRCSCTA
eukprot:2070721-Pyramimonas_sp.AAC.1